ncbi:hypothetical protein C1646_8177 [Rhizophagus diaphanus]|nr:hypothetical protein C1646_8177 [Rhizophagus diaphanus] [Rhizophagus sp. MUCL 43196]
MQAQVDMTQAQVVSTIATAKKKRLFNGDHNQAQPPSKNLLHGTDVNEEYSEITERENLRIQDVAVISSTITERENSRTQEVSVLSSTITERENSSTQEVAVLSSTITERENSSTQEVAVIFSTILLFFMYLVRFNPLLPQFTKTNISGMHEIINKIDNSTHRLFEYRIIDLSDRNAANPVNKIFTSTEIKSLKDFWDASEASCQFNAHDFKWEDIIKHI